MEQLQVSDETAFNIAYGVYVNECCKYCGFEAKSIKDLDDKDVRWVGTHSKGRWACKSCFDEHAHNDEDLKEQFEKEGEQ